MKKLTPKKLIEWTLEFTQTMIIVISLVWVASTIYSGIMVAYAIHCTGQFSFLDTFITEISTTFREIVGVAIIKFTVENIFKYNNFGGERLEYKPKKKAQSCEESSAEETDTNSVG